MLAKSLQKCHDDPNYLFDSHSFPLLQFPTSSPETKQKLASSLKLEMKKIIVTISEALLNTIKVQLGDVLEGGIYHTPSQMESVGPETPLTNLVCERHFGHLDASHRRRPHSSLHHHFSVMLLKQTRKRMRDWYGTLPPEEKEVLWKKTRTEGQRPRKKHKDQDRKAIMDSLHTLKLHEIEPELGHLPKNQMVAVAGENAWYPAVVDIESFEGQDVTVSFGELGKGLGVFKWPSGNDVHPVSRRSILEKNLEVEARAGGRLWFVTTAKEIQRKFKNV